MLVTKDYWCYSYGKKKWNYDLCQSLANITNSWSSIITEIYNKSALTVTIYLMHSLLLRTCRVSWRLNWWPGQWLASRNWTSWTHRLDEDQPTYQHRDSTHHHKYYHYMHVQCNTSIVMYVRCVTMAAPTARPAMPASVMGVSTRRRSPNFFQRPLVT